MKQFLVILSIACTLLVSGCNTVEGLGKDIKKAGEHIEERASK